jgi:hypothetical protein
MQAVFIILCFFYVFAIVLSEPYRAVLHWSMLAGLVLASPIFIFEFVWLTCVASAFVKAIAFMTLRAESMQFR